MKQFIELFACLNMLKKLAEEIAKEQIKSIESFIINEMIKKLEEKS